MRLSRFEHPDADFIFFKKFERLISQSLWYSSKKDKATLPNQITSRRVVMQTVKRVWSRRLLAISTPTLARTICQWSCMNLVSSKRAIMTIRNSSSSSSKLRSTLSSDSTSASGSSNLACHCLAELWFAPHQRASEMERRAVADRHVEAQMEETKTESENKYQWI